MQAYSHGSGERSARTAVNSFYALRITERPDRMNPPMIQFFLFFQNADVSQKNVFADYFAVASSAAAAPARWPMVLYRPREAARM